LLPVSGLRGFKLGKFQISPSETVPHLIGISFESLYKNVYTKCERESTKNRILIKNKYFFNLIILLYIIRCDNYNVGKRYSAREFIINNVQIIIVVLFKTFSAHLLVFFHIPPLILAKFRLTFLF